MEDGLVAILACRLKGTRLYGKPLQLLDIERGITVLESCAQYLQNQRVVKQIVLAISDEPENAAFIEIAKKHNWPFVLGHPVDVLGRIIKAADFVGAKNILRVTSECPFVATESLESCFRTFMSENLDYCSLEGLPEGSTFEIVKVDALKKSHRDGTSSNRSELVTSYIFQNQDLFKIMRPIPEEKLRRTEVRVTIDYPEDLIFCRKIYRDLKGYERLISIQEIINYWDTHLLERKQVESIGVDWGVGRLWK